MVVAEHRLFLWPCLPLRCESQLVLPTLEDLQDLINDNDLEMDGSALGSALGCAAAAGAIAGSVPDLLAMVA
jgi:hypothetical protein